MTCRIGTHKRDPYHRRRPRHRGVHLCVSHRGVYPCIAHRMCTRHLKGPEYCKPWRRFVPIWNEVHEPGSGVRVLGQSYVDVSELWFRVSEVNAIKEAVH